MKKLLFTLILASAAVSLAHGQGTIAFGNSALTRITIRPWPDGTLRNCLPVDNLVVGAFYGPANSPGSQLVLVPGLATIGSTAGVMINAPSVYALPGTEAGEIVSLQIRAWYASFGTDWQAAKDSGYYFAETDVRQVTLGPTAGPGTVIWQSATGTNPNRFNPLGPIVGIPEPSTLALAMLCGVALLARMGKGRKGR